MNLKKGFWRLTLVLSLVVLVFLGIFWTAKSIGEKRQLGIEIGAAAAALAITWAMIHGVLRIYLYIKRGFLDETVSKEAKKTKSGLKES